MRRLAHLAVLLLFGVAAFSQSGVVTGQIKDDKNNPIAYATVKVEGSNSAVMADADGKFSIELTKRAVLQISAVNFETMSVATEPGAWLQIALKRSANLEEVVVTALGVKRKPKELGYANATLTPEAITAGKTFNLAQALSGKVSGLIIQNTSNSVNASPRIVLRGLRSITGDNTALVVVDGVPVPSSTINYINPNDVENITVLKGGQAATLFGSDGVNGAIVITTKKGTGTPTFTVTHTGNIEKVAYLPQTQHEFGSGSAYGADINEQFHPAENQQYGPAYDGSIRPLGRTLSDGSYQLYPYADISDVRERIWNTGYTAQTDVAYRGGDESSSFFVSFQNLNSNGIVPKDKYARNSFRMNGAKNYGKVKLNFDASYSWDRADRTNTDFYFFSLNTPSWVPLDQLKDWQNNKFANPNGYFNDYYNNPWWLLDNNRFETKNNVFNGSLALNYKAASFLELTYRLGINTTNGSVFTPSNKFVYSTWAKSSAYLQGYNQNYDPFLTGRGYNRARTPVNGSLADASFNNTRLNSDLYATINKEFDRFSLKAIIGNNIQVVTGKNLSTRTASLAIDGLYNFGYSASGLFAASNARTERRKIGSYADATIGYNNFVFLHTAFRYDLSSVFYKAGRPSSLYGFAYYGADISIVVSDIFPSIKSDVLNYLKLRGGWNKNGNDNLNPYSLLSIYPTATGFPYSGLLGTTIGDVVVAPDLKPEVIHSTEVGAELSLWQNRITLEGSYFNQRSKNQILNVSISSATGFYNYVLNAADVTNKGFEFDGKLNVLRTPKWNINVNANYTYTTNVVNKLYANTGLNSLQYQGNTMVSLNAEVGQMFPYLKTTAWERDDQGRIIVSTEDGWPLRATAMVGQGSTTPKHILGVGGTVSFGDFSFMANAEFRGGYIVYHDIGQQMSFTGSGALTALYHRDQFIWPNSVYYDGTKYVPNTDIAVANHLAIYQGFGDLNFSRGYNGIGEVFVSSGDFWKLRDVSLTYDLPRKVLDRIKAVKGLSVTIWGRNLKTWLAEDNYFTDPEFSNTSGNAQGINTTLNTPPTMQMGGTLRVTL